MMSSMICVNSIACLSSLYIIIIAIANSDNKALLANEDIFLNLNDILIKTNPQF